MKKIMPLICFIALFTACDEDEEIQKWLKEAENLKIETQKNIDRVPYQKEQHQIFKDYFLQINQIPLNLQNNEEFREPFNDVFMKSDLEALCLKVLIGKQEWSNLMSHCVKNRFFLCSEEVRSYPLMIQSLKRFFEPDLQKKFMGTPACQDIP